MKTNTQIKTPGNDKNAAIETLRALAVALVFVHHLYSGANIVLLPFVAHIGGWLGVQIFFVVSGYLIIISAKRYSIKNYARHRFMRIYPAYIFWFLIFSLIFGQLTLQSLDTKALLAHLTFLQHLFPKYYYKYNALFVSWTLTIEVALYVIAFLCVAKFYRHPIKITCISMAISYMWIVLGLSDFVFNKSLDPNAKFFFANNNFVSQLPFFFFGALIAVKSPRLDKTGLASIFLLTVILSPAWKPHFPDPIFITGFGVAALFLILKDIKYVNPKFVKLLSDISYSFYLIHYPIIVLVSKSVGDKTLVTTISISATVALAYLSYRFIEQPFIKLAKRNPKVATA